MGVGTDDLRHRVQFFENAETLAERVTQFLVEGLRRGAHAVALARAAHLAAIEQRLAEAGIDVANARSLDKLVLIDAQDVIDAIVVDGHPDAAKFQELARARMPASRDLQVYGEVVDVLWERGQRDATFELEQLWTCLLREQPITLLCGYRLGTFGHDLDSLDGICSVHEGVESIDATQAIRMLEQRAFTLEREVERRRRADQRMQELLVVTTELAAASDRQTVAKLVVDSSRAAVGAAYAGAWVLSGDSLVLLSASEAGQDVARRFERVPLAADIPPTRAVRTGEAVFLANLGEYAELFPDSFRRFAALGQSTYRAFAVLPFHCHGLVTGVISYTYDHDHPFEESERTFMRLLARQCGIAFERIHHAEVEKASRADVELLYELIATNNRLDQVEDVYAFALRSVMRGSKSDRSAILLFDKDDARSHSCRSSITGVS